MSSSLCMILAFMYLGLSTTQPAFLAGAFVFFLLSFVQAAEEKKTKEAKQQGKRADDSHKLACGVELQDEQARRDALIGVE